MFSILCSLNKPSKKTPSSLGTGAESPPAVLPLPTAPGLLAAHGGPFLSTRGRILNHFFDSRRRQASAWSWFLYVQRPFLSRRVQSSFFGEPKFAQKRLKNLAVGGVIIIIVEPFDMNYSAKMFPRPRRAQISSGSQRGFFFESAIKNRLRTRVAAIDCAFPPTQNSHPSEYKSCLKSKGFRD